MLEHFPKDEVLGNHSLIITIIFEIKQFANHRKTFDMAWVSLFQNPVGFEPAW
jgi:hypothetical protein